MIVALIALSAFGLVLVLARRLRSVTERVNLFLPAGMGSLPLPGTPVAEFTATSTDGQVISHADFGDEDRIFAMLSTGCGDCTAELAAFAELDGSLAPLPIVAVMGPPEDRAPMVAALADHVVVLEEGITGSVSAAFEISEYPAVLLVRDGYIQVAEHRLAPVLAALSLSRASAPAASQR